MTGGGALRALRWLTRSCANGSLQRPNVTRCFSTSSPWDLATEASISSSTPATGTSQSVGSSSVWTPPPPVLTTIYSWPSMEPIRLAEYSPRHLQMPLRRDILHRAIVYEGNKSRAGTANTKWRDEVRGSGRKIQPQKGTGRARVGDKKSPIRRGGGVAFGPKPRDFSTGLPRKVYDQAWRIALSYRYSCGQLIVVDDKMSLPEDASPWFMKHFFQAHRWGRNHGRSTLITDVVDDDLFAAIQELPQDARILERSDVDVKDLLETGRLIIEKKALDNILWSHSKDLLSQPARAKYD